MPRRQTNTFLTRSSLRSGVDPKRRIVLYLLAQRYCEPLAPTARPTSSTPAPEHPDPRDHNRARHALSWKRHFNNIPSIMRNKPMSAVLRTIANRFLCTESYDFLVRVSGYRRSSADAGEMELGPQHALFVDICKVTSCGGLYRVSCAR